jgi:hypothetical protein
MFLAQVRIWVTQGQKLGHTTQTWQSLIYILEVIFSPKISGKFARKVVFMISISCLTMGHPGPKTSIYGPNIEISLNHSRVILFSFCNIEIGQKGCLYDFLKFGNGLSGVKNRSHSKNMRKPCEH